jgi:hypothetical protein
MDDRTLDIEYVQLVYRQCLESVAPAENERMQARSHTTWRDTKQCQEWGRMGNKHWREYRAEPRGK